MVRDDLLIWMDLEMSGLDPRRERILELACLVTDSELQVVAEGPEIVIRQSRELLDGMDDWNREHHGESGLVDRVLASEVDEAAAETTVIEFLAEIVTPRTAPLAGNSIHQDRRFIQEYMPRLDELLHYRNVDVSTIKELVRRWQPVVFEGAPVKRGSHRAIDDIRESIEELRYYRQRAFR
ncbi:MAG: oligoribonuclease [Planctomycetes bacterium]|nr:oligoribonuclease [Planctomycetota bacterium]